VLLKEGKEQEEGGRRLVFTFGRARENFRALCLLFFNFFKNNIIFFNMRKKIKIYFLKFYYL